MRFFFKRFTGYILHFMMNVITFYSVRSTFYVLCVTFLRPMFYLVLLWTLVRVVVRNTFYVQRVTSYDQVFRFLMNIIICYDVH